MKDKTSNQIGSFPVTKQIFSRDKTTGELKDLGEVEIHTKAKNRNAGFFMLWTHEIKPKDLKIKVLFFLIQNMSNKGSIRITNEQLAKRFEVNEKTIRKLKQTMREEGYIKYEPKFILINPGFIWKGTATQREKANAAYLAFEQK